MHISNREGWTISLTNNSISVTDPNKKLRENPSFLIDDIVVSKEEAVNKIATLSTYALNNRSFQVFTKEGKTAVLIGSYGLRGGGKVEALAASIAGLVAGVALSFKNRKAGQALIMSSYNAAVYAYKTPDEKFKDEECLKVATIAGVTSLAASALGDTLKGSFQNAVSNPLSAQILSQGIVSVAQEGASQAMKGELDVARMAISVASGTASVLAGGRVDELIEAKEVSEIILKAGVTGSISASAATLTEDLLTGQSLLNIPAAALSAAALSSINSVSGAFETSAAIKAAEDAKKNISAPQEPQKDAKKQDAKKEFSSPQGAQKDSKKQETPSHPAPPEKPDLSSLNLEKRRQALELQEREVAAKEANYATAFNKAKNWVSEKLNEGFYDRATWAKTADQTAGRIINGETVKMRRDLGGMDHLLKIKGAKVPDPVNERAAVNNAKAELAKDEALANALLKAYDANLAAYNNQKIGCPGPVLTPVPVIHLRVEKEEANFLGQLESRHSIEISTQVNIPYRIETNERIERASQAVIGSNAPKTAIASINRIISPNQALLIQPTIEGIQRLEKLKDSLEKKKAAIEKAKTHLAYLQDKKDHARKGAREKKRALNAQIDAHNKRLDNLLKNP